MTNDTLKEICKRLTFARKAKGCTQCQTPLYDSMLFHPYSSNTSLSITIINIYVNLSYNISGRKSKYFFLYFLDFFLISPKQLPKSINIPIYYVNI